jgi:ferritin
LKLSIELNDYLNKQANHELANIAKYKQIASYFEDLRLLNLAKKFYLQADEEYNHFSKVIKYINSRIGGKYFPAELETIDLGISSPKDVGQIYLDTEVGTTEALEEISEYIYDSRSYIDVSFIQEMLLIQVEEEDSADEFMKKINMVSDIVLFDATLESD